MGAWASPPALKKFSNSKIRDDNNCFRDYSGGHETRPYDFGGRFTTAVQKAVCTSLDV